MNNLEKIAIEAEKFALSEIEKFWLPSKINLEISINEWIKLAKKLNVDEDLVKIWVCLMDIKLWQAFSEKRIWEHIKMSVESAKEFLSKYNLEKKYYDIIIESVEWHHWKKFFDSLEAEIVANADCYRFLSPKWIFNFLANSNKIFWDDFIKKINFIETKMDEKIKIVSLDIVKKELEPIYKNMKNYLDLCK